MRSAITDNVIKMLSCGMTVRGYAVFECSNTECSHQKKICFSCKSRFCPTCGKKLTDQWIEQQKTILPVTQWQHITFTMPAELWALFRYNRSLLGRLSGLAAKIILKVAGKKGIRPGIFTALHTFGRNLKWNVHVHLSVTVGGLSNDNRRWKTLYFCKKTLMPMWRYEVINLLRQTFNRGELALPKFIKRLVQHIPDTGFRMIRYYGFLATRVRSKLLPTVYDLLDQPERKAIPIRFPTMMKSSFGVDPLECILCKSRMVMTAIVPGKTMAELRQCHARLALNRPIALA